ncbi:MAG: TonB-dependent receptor [Parvibaculum sp.]|nr:TonB-dependent receptor [Parvibaculum sp.]
MRKSIGANPAAERLRLLLLTSASVLVIAASPAIAQEAEEYSIDLAPLIVEGKTEPLPAPYAGGQVATGARIGVLGNRDIMDVPFSVTSYTEELIRNQQATSIGDVVANDPSVRSSYGFGIFGEQFVIRGFELFSDDIAIDGVYGITPRQLPGIEMFERVEVLKGASAFLNGVPPGGSGTGGSINLVPKRAQEVPTRRVTAGYSMGSQVSGHADVGQRFGANNEWGIRLNVAGRTGETAIDNEERDYLLGAAALDYRGEDFRLSLDTVHQKQRVDQGRPIVQLGALPSVPNAPDSSTNYGASWLYSEMEDTFVLLKGEYDLTDHITTYASAGIREMREDSDGASPTLTALNGNATVVRGTVAREDSVYTLQGGLRAEFVTGAISHDVNAGTSLTSQRNRNAYEFSDFGAPLPTNIYNPVNLPRPGAGAFVEGSLDSPPLAEKVELSSFYLSDTLSFMDENVHLTLGVRDQRIHVRTYNRTTGAMNAEYDESEISPFAGVAVNVTDQVTLYANMIEGLAQGPTSPGTVLNPNQTFPPFTSEQYEIGGKVDLGSFGFGAALFQIEQPSAYTNAANVFVVDGEQRNRGIELNMFGEPAEGIRLLGGVTFLDAELTSTALGANDGNTAVGVPDYLVNLTGEWDLPFLAGVTVMARVLYTAEQYADAANTQEVPDWTRLDLGARYTADFGNRPVTFNLFVENVTDESYWASANGGYLTMGDPLTAKFSVSTEF